MTNLTSKELSALEDQLETEKNTIAKYTMYAQTTGDIALKTKYEQMASKHRQHFDMLKSCLE